MEHIETHISLVELDGDRVRKRIKPQRLSFADFSTRSLRRAACENEIAHNRPWAPGVYLGVVEVHGEPAVEMVRLDARDCLDHQVGRVGVDAIRTIGRRIAAVLDEAPRRGGAAHATSVRRRIHDNLDEMQAMDGVPAVLLARIRDAVDTVVERCAEELVERMPLGRVLHGDLRVEHVYLRSEGVTILDGVAFDPALAEGDPADDVAFLVMDLTCTHGRWDLEGPLWEAAGIDASRPLRDLYVAHRALIRAKVAVLSSEPEAARRFLLHALTRVADPSDRPALVGVGGLPGVGKSSLAAQLGRFHRFEVVRSDVVRKQDDTSPDYTDAGRTRVYEQVLKVAAERVAGGGRIVVDASFGRDAWRALYRETARRLGLRPLLLLCHTPPGVALDRLARRSGDASDADGAVYHLAVRTWEPVASHDRPWTTWIDTAATSTETLAEAAEALTVVGLADGYPSGGTR